MRSIMLVSNDRQFATEIHGDLTDRGYFVMVASSTPDYEALYSSLLADLLIIDSDLGFDEMTAVRNAVRSSEQGDLIPIVVVSDSDEPMLLAKILSDGFAGVIPRSSRGGELVERLEILGGDFKETNYIRPREGKHAYSFARDRDWFESMGLVEWGYSRQNKTPVSIIMLAMENVDAMVEQHGMERIAAAMSTVEIIARAEISSRDTFARYDLGMVGIVLAETSIKDAELLGWSLREILGETEFGSVAQSFKPSFSAGVTSQEAGELRGWTEMKKEAVELARSMVQRDTEAIWSTLVQNAVDRAAKRNPNDLGSRAA